MAQYIKNCEPRIKYLVMRFSHDLFNWSQEVLLMALRLCDLDPYIDLERNRIDAVLTIENEIINTEHKFIGLITKRESNLITMIDKIKRQIESKSLDLIIFTSLTIKYPDSELFLFNFNVCLHVIQIKGDHMASAKTEEISKEIIDRIEMDDDEELITPLNAKMLLMMENQQQYNERKFEELKIEIKEELKKDNKELKKDYRELKKDNKELKKDNKELKIEIKEELNLLKKSNEQLKKSNDRISKLLEQLLLKSDK